MIQVLNILLYDKGMDNAVNEFLISSAEGVSFQNRCISATGAHGMVYSYRNQQFKSILDSFYWNLPDGVPGVWIGKLKGAKKMTRCYGPDFFREVIIRSAELPMNHFFCGGKEGVAEELKYNCIKNFHNSSIVGTYSPPFKRMSDEELNDLANIINERNTDILWIGLSTPKQEEFALRLSKFTKVKYLVTVGAAFDFHTGKVKQAPRIMQKIGMEWFFRLLTEPKRLFKRYFEIVPLFIIFNIKEFLVYLFKKIIWSKNYA